MTLEKGKKYTRIGVSNSMLPAAFRTEFTVKDIYGDGRPVIVNRGKRKRYLFNDQAYSEEAIFVEGWDILPKLESEIDYGGGLKQFVINGFMNFVGATLEDIRVLLKNNLNENFKRFDLITVTVSGTKVPITELDSRLKG